MINKDLIDEALNFYNIDIEYKDKCNSCVEQINRKVELSLDFQIYIRNYILKNLQK